MRIKKIILCLFLFLIYFSPAYGQELKQQDLLIRQQLQSDYNYLDTTSIKLDTPLEKALAKTEIAKGLWWLDTERAKKLLKDAFELTIPDKDVKEKTKGKEISPGLFAPSQIEKSRNLLRNKIFEIALRDKKFSNQLIQLAENKLNENEGAKGYSKLAGTAAAKGDLASAEQYLASAIMSGQFQSGIGYAITSIAEKDRDLADKIILQYLSEMRTKQISPATLQSVVAGLDVAVFADNEFLIGNRHISPANPETIKLYLDFMLDKIRETGEIQPNNLIELRGTIVSLWRRISIYAPELIGKFQLLEQASRLNPNDDNLPEPVTPEKQRDFDNDVIKKAEETRKPEDIERAISTALRLKNYKKARELAGLYQDEKKQKQALNRINTEESLDLIEKKELDEAERIAGKIEEPRLILKVYSLLIQKYADKKDKNQAQNLAYETVRRLKSFDKNISLPYQLSQLTKAVAAIDTELAFNLLNETVRSLNKKDFDADSAEIGFDRDVFVRLAKIDEERSRQMAEILSDNLQKIVALASIYEWKTKEIIQKEKSLKQPAEKQLTKN